MPRDVLYREAPNGYPRTMEQDLNAQPESAPHVTEAGKRAMRVKLAERKTSRDVDAIRALRERLRLGPPASA